MGSRRKNVRRFVVRDGDFLADWFRLMEIAFSHKFVMHGVLAWAAAHLYRVSGQAETMELTYHHRARCLRGLQNAIDKFSADNSDAVLAASVLLGWQATDV